jgi:hypothetical protein
MNFSKSIFNSILLVSLLLSCKSVTDSVSPSTTGGTGIDSLIPLEQLESSTDYSYDANTSNIIKFNGSSVSVTGTGAKASGSIVTISSAGTYAISGTTTNGQIVVQTDAKEAVKLVLNGLDITNTSTSPIFIDKAYKTILILPKATNNKITDGTTYTSVAEGQNAAIYAQSYLAITGEGNLEVKGNFEDGIGAKDGLLINGGNITVNAKDEGIRGKDYLVIRDGNFNVTTTSGDGIKSDYEGDTKYGYILIDKGTFKITSQGDAITAETTVTIKGGNFDVTTGGGSTKTVATGVSAKGIKASGLIKVAANNASFNGADDAINSNTEIIIEKGTYTISSADDGIHANATVTIQDGSVTITKCFEGIEAKTINIEKGLINIISSNDCINATAGTDAQQDDGSMINIKGGTLVLDGQNGDPLDSNGGMTMTDGTIIIHGPSGAEVPIDYNASFVVSKGFIIASGSNGRMLQAPSTSSKINSLKLLFNTTNAANTVFNITDDAGQTLVTFKPTKSYGSIVFTSEKLIQGKTYTINTGGSITGANTGGYYTGAATGVTKRGTFTISSAVTNVTL